MNENKFKDYLQSRIIRVEDSKEFGEYNIYVKKSELNKVESEFSDLFLLLTVGIEDNDGYIRVFLVPLIESRHKTKRDYISHCFSCKKKITSVEEKKCTKCRWLKCNNCGSCGCNFRGEYILLKQLST
ncbi:hypothetical protein J2T12_003951 [Paenibacillus anaericanus]|uniref:hypothetical protein n=1 Tax=Paenibacillus anaericanus TaxID=170367 RepID=UPI00277E7ED6|nr:hypothetical protein [Paenibacillus anaericanus]MDQ0090528.1 hypothetical protein [Paenibacillus anaericanus]